MAPARVPKSDRDLQIEAAMKALQESSRLLSQSILSGPEDQIEKRLASFRGAKGELFKAIAHLVNPKHQHT
jgi:hypothetical protein